MPVARSLPLCAFTRASFTQLSCRSLFRRFVALLKMPAGPMTRSAGGIAARKAAHCSSPRMRVRFPYMAWMSASGGSRAACLKSGPRFDAAAFAWLTVREGT